MPDSATPRLIRDDSRNSWIAKDASTVQAVFTSSACHVRPTAEPVPSAFLGTPAGEIYRRLVRMNDGAFHAARKPALERALGGVNLDHVRAECDRWAIRMMNEATHPVDVDHLLFDLPTATLASVLGVPDADVPELLPQVRDFALSIPGGASADQLGQGILAAGYLLRLFQRLLPIAPSGSFLASLQREMRYVGETDPDTTIANTIGFFFQAYEGTAGLVASALIAIASNEPSETRDAVRAIERHRGRTIARRSAGSGREPICCRRNGDRRAKTQRRRRHRPDARRCESVSTSGRNAGFLLGRIWAACLSRTGDRARDRRNNGAQSRSGRHLRSAISRTDRVPAIRGRPHSAPEPADPTIVAELKHLPMTLRSHFLPRAAARATARRLTRRWQAH